ncbi:MAG: preprotein translocase subunit SecG [Opitutales bacterium]
MAALDMVGPFLQLSVVFMGTLLISLLTLVLLLISAFIVLIVLMQRTSQSGGMGAALGGGAAESAFGSETNSILMKGTVYGIVAFFVVALGLYLLYQSASVESSQEIDMSPFITSDEAGDVAETVTAVVDSVDTEGTGEAVPQSVVIEAEAAEAEVNEAVDSVEAAEEALPATN